MTSVSNQPSAIIRTKRGLTIAGTRITLYDVMDTDSEVIVLLDIGTHDEVY